MEGERPRLLSRDGVREAGFTSFRSALRTRSRLGPGVGRLRRPPLFLWDS